MIEFDFLRVFHCKNILNFLFKHDVYLAAMQRLLGTSEKYVNPNFGSAFIVELRQSKTFPDQYYVRVLNKNTLYPGAIRFDVVRVQGNYLQF